MSFYDNSGPEAEFLDVIRTKCYSQSPLLKDLPPPPLHPPNLSKSGLKLVSNVNTVYGNRKSENSQDYAQKPQRNCTFMNSASEVRICRTLGTGFTIYSISKE
jgi:hypothetical protein